MDLPAFLLSKNVYSESIGMPRSAVLTAALTTMTAMRSRRKSARDVSGGTYLSALRELAFQLCFWQPKKAARNKKPGVECVFGILGETGTPGAPDCLVGLNSPP